MSSFTYFVVNLSFVSSSVDFFLETMFSAQVFEGHPFIVEAGVSLGGRDVKQASHILLLFIHVSSSSHRFKVALSMSMNPP
jgi:hypothetical protein